MAQNISCGNCGEINLSMEEFCTKCGYELAGGPVNSRRITGSLRAGDTLDGGRYCITEMIGEGGFGAVYKATDERFQSKPVVALKEMSEAQLSPSEKAKALQDFRNEADLLVQLKHPNLPNVRDFFEDGGKAYLVMEFIEGKTLEKLQEEQNDPLDESLVMGWALQLCTVLDYLHTQSPPIIFRDLKPANVMVTSKGEIKLIDFGIARLFQATANKYTVPMGTQGYAPPEQYGRGQCDARSDIYALGATLYSLLTKNEPIDAPTRMLHPNLFFDPSHFNPNISPAVEAIILKAMALRPENRYQKADDMSKAITAIVSPPTAAATPPTAAATPPTAAATPPTAAATPPTAAATPPTAAATPPTAAATPPTAAATPPTAAATPPTAAATPPTAAATPPTAAATPPTAAAMITKSIPVWVKVIAGLLILALCLGVVIKFIVLPILYPNAIRAWQAPNGEYIGLSDGRYAFDTGSDRADASLKQSAANYLAKGDKGDAERSWNQAIQMDSNDAEALIYLEDQRVLDSGSPYITIVVGTMLTGDDNDLYYGRSNLQGAYVAQKEYNAGFKLSGGRQIRILIANAGSSKLNGKSYDYVKEVAGQIVQAENYDKTIVGVMGWPTSGFAQAAIPVLASAHIPMISSTASADNLDRMSSYFFRVAALDKDEASAAVKYADQQLHASRVVLFVAPGNDYSKSLAKDFKDQFGADGHQLIDTEDYTVGDQADLPGKLTHALSYNPDLIYFAGYPDDLSVLLDDLGTNYPNLQVLGGDSLYAPNGYPSDARVGLYRLHFTAFAYPDEWNILGNSDPQLSVGGNRYSLLREEYAQDFDPGNHYPNYSTYGYSRTDVSTMLSYDAMYALLQGSQNVLSTHKALTPATLRDGLAKINGANPIQGVSGQISFDKNGDPMNKAIVMLYIDQDDHTQMVPTSGGWRGCFVVGQC